VWHNGHATAILLLHIYPAICVDAGAGACTVQAVQQVLVLAARLALCTAAVWPHPPALLPLLLCGTILPLPVLPLLLLLL
jgi:hypothetical protein